VPSILSQPQSRTVTNGSPVLFQVSAASGLGPLRYQWQRGGIDLPGQTNASLSLPSVQPADAGAYQVVVSNGDTSVTSAVAQLRVVTASGITQIARVGAAWRLSFSTVSGASYTIEYTDILPQTNWTVLITVSGNDQVLTVEDSQPGPRRFYRLRIE
jgi:hypothetical protein